MAVVGDFTPTETTDPGAEADTFTFCGETFEIPATVGTGRVIRFAWLIKGALAQGSRGENDLRKALTDEGRAKARQEMAESDLSATAAMYDLLLACLGEGQIDRFISVADANGVTQNGYTGVCDEIQGVIAGRPTQRSADSSAGPSTNGPTSTVDGSGLTEMTPRDQQAAAILEASTSVADLPG